MSYPFNADKKLTPNDLIRIERVCDAFESRLLSQLDANIESLIEQERDPAAREHLLGNLIAAEINCNGNVLTRSRFQQYLDRFPENELIIRRLFEAHDLTNVTGEHRTMKAGQGGSPDFEFAVSQMIGKYRIVNWIGSGSFGVVYHAVDTELERDVALKISKFESRQADGPHSVDEARMSAQLKADGIATVYDYFRKDGRDVIVQEYVPGKNLSQVIALGSLTIKQSVQLICRVAEAIARAHEAGVFHRDLKPRNIIIGSDEKPTVVDFGLAHRADASTNKQGLLGTPRYMSPEQVRGETNRTNATTDVWALGVILYQMVTGQRPFDTTAEADNDDELFQAIEYEEPVPPNQLALEIPFELNRIILKCLDKRQSNRFENGGQLADDLQRFLDSPRIDRSVASFDESALIPRGLSPFSHSDNEFFLPLVPGPRDRQGIPESVSFWKNWIESPAQESEHPVGMIHGASGCGKSSFIQAAVLPLLSARTKVLFVEATPDATELRILDSLRDLFPELEEDSLPRTFAELRDGNWLAEDEQFLIVIDQFEQWLASNRSEERQQLGSSLRHCDGRLKCLLLIRDDFWPDASAFMDELEISLVPNINNKRQTLPDKRHARDILKKFGCAHGKFGDTLGTMENRFLDSVVEELESNGKVLPIQLALFVETFQDKNWNSHALAELGGLDAGVAKYLNDKFLSDDATREYKSHFNAAQACLFEMLPPEGSDLKGNMQPEYKLRETAGYSNAPEKFDQLIKILDNDLKLITPTAPTSSAALANDDVEKNQNCFQLSHDYLVPILRNWIASEKQRFFTGRVRERMGQVSSIWGEVPTKRYLPSWIQNAQFRLFTDSKSWTPVQQKMMAASRKHHFAKTLVGTALALLAAYGVFWSVRNIQDERVVSAIKAANFDKVEKIVDQNRPRKQRLASKLYREIGVLTSSQNGVELSAEAASQKLNVAVALAMLQDSNWEEVERSAFTAPETELEQIARILAPKEKETIRANYKKQLLANSTDISDTARRKALMLCYLGEPQELAKFATRLKPAEAKKLGAIVASHQPEKSIAALKKLQSQAKTEVLSFPSEKLKKAIDTNGGVIDRTGAVVFSVPIDKIDAIMQMAFDENFVPTSYRPFKSENDIRVAVSWIRNCEFVSTEFNECIRFKTGMNSNEIQKLYKSNKESGWRLTDLSFIKQEHNGEMQPRFSALWHRNVSKIDTRLELNVTVNQLNDVLQHHSKDGFHVACAFSDSTENGEPRYSLVWQKSPKGSPIQRGEYYKPITKFERGCNADSDPTFADCQICEIDLSRRYLFEHYAIQANELVVGKEYQSNPSLLNSEAAGRRVRNSSMVARRLGNIEFAKDLSSLLPKHLPRWLDSEFEFAKALATQGRREELDKEISRCKKCLNGPSEGQLLLRIPNISLLCAVRNKNHELAQSTFEEIHASAETMLESYTEPIYIAAIYRNKIIANLLLSQLYSNDSAKQSRLVEEALSWLEHVKSNGYQHFLVIQEFNAARQSTQFQDFLRNKGYGYRTTAVRSNATKPTVLHVSKNDNEFRQRASAALAQGLEPRRVSCVYMKHAGSNYCLSIWSERSATNDQIGSHRKLINIAILLAELGDTQLFQEIVTNKYGQIIQLKLAELFVNEPK